MREKVRPKMGKIDIDYQKLHDAFFKYQTKPKMTGHGDLYYEVIDSPLQHGVREFLFYKSLKYVLSTKSPNMYGYFKSTVDLNVQWAKGTGVCSCI